MLEQIKKPVLLGKILRALALQIDSEVSLTEVGQFVGADNKTVEKYIGLLAKTYIVIVFYKPELYKKCIFIKLYLIKNQILEDMRLVFRIPAYSGSSRKKYCQQKTCVFLIMDRSSGCRRCKAH